MTIDLFIYTILFIITIGVVATAVLLTYEMHKTYKKNYLQTLLYQQIFLYSFFLYGIWGRITLNEILGDFNFTEHIIQKIQQFILILGMPFLILSWYMLIKFFQEVKGNTLKRWFAILYFSVFTVSIIAGAIFVRYKGIEDSYPIRNSYLKIINIINLAIHILLIINSVISPVSKKTKIISVNKGLLVIYLSGILIYSTGVWFIPILNTKINAATIFFLFIVSGFLPLIVRISLSDLPTEKHKSEKDFETFCKHFEISKREAEIIREICQGKSNKDIADSLFITLQTVKDHTHRIYTKTGVNNRVMLTNLVREKVK